MTVFGFVIAMALASQAKASDGAPDLHSLGKGLTPIGAETAGSSDGTIPAWTGGEPQRGSPVGEVTHNEKIDGEKPLFTISRDNYDKYSDKLSEGHKELLKRYADYKMNV